MLQEKHGHFFFIDVSVYTLTTRGSFSNSVYIARVGEAEVISELCANSEVIQPEQSNDFLLRILKETRQTVKFISRVAQSRIFFLLYSKFLFSLGEGTTSSAGHTARNEYARSQVEI